MKLTKTLFAGLLAVGILSSCNSSNDDPKFEMTIPRNLFVKTSNSATSQSASTLTSAKVTLDMYNNTTAIFILNNVRMPNGMMEVVSAGPMKYTDNSIGYRFLPQAGTAYSGVSDPSVFDFYMGGINQVNSRLRVEDGDLSLLGYSNTMYLFSSATITGGTTPFTTTEATKNVIQFLIQNGDRDGQFKATLYWMKPDFDNNITVEGNMGIAGLSASIDVDHGTLSITGGDTPIVPKKVDDGSSTLTTEMTDYKVSNVRLTVGDFSGSVNTIEFDFEYTPKVAEGETPVTKNYHFSAVLRESPANN